MLATKQQHLSNSLLRSKAPISAAASLSFHRCNYSVLAANSQQNRSSPQKQKQTPLPFSGSCLPFTQQRNHTLAARIRTKLYYQFPFLRGFKPETNKKKIAILGTGNNEHWGCLCLCVFNGLLFYFIITKWSQIMTPSVCNNDCCHPIHEYVDQWPSHFAVLYSLFVVHLIRRLGLDPLFEILG